MTKYAAELKNFTLTQLVEIYNKVAENPVKAFRDKSAATKRVETALRIKSLWVDEEGNLEEAINLETRTTGRANYAETDRIELNIKENPKVKGKLSHARFALYRNGMTVGEYLDAAYMLQPGVPRYKYYADIKWDSEHQYILVFSQHE